MFCVNAQTVTACLLSPLILVGLVSQPPLDQTTAGTSISYTERIVPLELSRW